MNKLSFIFVAMCLCFGAQVRGADARIVDFGIYRGSNQVSYENGNSPSGNVLLGGTVKVVTQTNYIPAKIGTKFGFQFLVSSSIKSDPLKFVYSYPEIKNPNTGQVSSSFVTAGKYNGDGVPIGMLYDFSDPWELVPGEWTFQIFDGAKMLLEKRFTVVKAE